jgi:hypothetical protein
MTLLEQLIEEFPNKPWNWIKLSINSSISFDFIKSHPNLPWVPKMVTLNPNVNDEVIKNNPSYKWDYHAMCTNENISFQFIFNTMINTPDQIYIDWDKLSLSKGTSLENIRQYHNYPWNDKYLSYNPNINSHYILIEEPNRKWYMPAISANPGITERDIFKNKLNWDYLNLSANPNLPIHYVSENINHPWNFHSISSSKKITMSELDDYSNIKWDYDGISINSNIFWEYISDNISNPWNFKAIVSNNSIKLNTVLDNYELIQSYGKFNKMEIEKYLCNNNNITYEWVIENIRFINFDYLSSNQI